MLSFALVWEIVSQNYGKTHSQNQGSLYLRKIFIQVMDHFGD